MCQNYDPKQIMDHDLQRAYDGMVRTGAETIADKVALSEESFQHCIGHLLASPRLFVLKHGPLTLGPVAFFRLAIRCASEWDLETGHLFVQRGPKVEDVALVLRSPRHPIITDDVCLFARLHPSSIQSWLEGAAVAVLNARYAEQGRIYPDLYGVRK